MARFLPVLLLLAAALGGFLLLTRDAEAPAPPETARATSEAIAAALTASEAPPMPEATQASPAVVDLSLSAAPAAAPAAAPRPAPRELTEAERAFGRWHRSLAGRRHELAGLAPDLAATLTDFLDLFGRGHAAALDRMRSRRPAGAGPLFERLARAYLDQGAPGLETALRRSGGGAPALAWQEFLGMRSLREQQFGRAAPALGATLAGMLEAGYPRDRILELQEAVNAAGDRASEFLPYKEYTVEAGDSLRQICVDQRKQGVQIWFGWLRLFNRKGSSNTIRVGQKLKIPQTSLRAEIWRDARILVVFAGAVPVRLYSVSVGQDSPATATPVGRFQIGIHEKNPTYWPAEGRAIPFGNPDNPLGTRWLGFEEPSQYGIHGTNSEPTIGSYETLGCVRMHNAEVEQLYDLLPNRAEVVIHP